jgi:hypothetical protein
VLSGILRLLEGAHANDCPHAPLLPYLPCIVRPYWNISANAPRLYLAIAVL